MIADKNFIYSPRLHNGGITDTDTDTPWNVQCNHFPKFA